jgi:hypothetical protein
LHVNLILALPGLCEIISGLHAQPAIGTTAEGLF